MVVGAAIELPVLVWVPIRDVPAAIREVGGAIFDTVGRAGPFSCRVGICFETDCCLVCAGFVPTAVPGLRRLLVLAMPDVTGLLGCGVGFRILEDKLSPGVWMFESSRIAFASKPVTIEEGRLVGDAIRDTDAFASVPLGIRRERLLSCLILSGSAILSIRIDGLRNSTGACFNGLCQIIRWGVFEMFIACQNIEVERGCKQSLELPAFRSFKP